MCVFVVVSIFLGNDFFQPTVCINFSDVVIDNYFFQDCFTSEVMIMNSVGDDKQF